MITAVHNIIYTSETEATRAFFRDTLNLPFTDAGHGWLIFALPPAELGIHPGGENHHELYLMCDDIVATVEEMKGKGVEFTSEIKDRGWGLLSSFKVPGAGEMSLYQARHASPLTTAPLTTTRPA